MQAQFFEIYRAGLKSAADMLTASMESAQRMQQQQLDVLRTALDDQAKSVREISEVRSVGELMALQTRLASSQAQRTMDFWSRMWRAAGDNQVAIMGQAQAQLGQVRDHMRDVAVSTSTAMSNAVRETSHQEHQEHRKHQERKSA
jgi:phasin family protein